jgi:adenylate cyclase
MSDIFISYARPNEALAKLAGEALRSLGYDVWRDDELPAHRSYGEVIEERIKSAKAVLVLWSNEAVRSQWVRAEADAARELGTLVQVSLDGMLPPMPFNQIQCADLMGWRGDTAGPGWQKVVSSIATLAGSAAPVSAGPSSAAEPAGDVMVCVLPFQNMSGDAEQEYFSDGISEDIIVDLSKVSSLSVVARNTAFALKGKPADIPHLTRDLGVTHLLEGSVRKAGSRVRIIAELLDCASGQQLWAERFDRDLTDIFAIQDEISKAIVSALQLKLLPKEKKAIEHRGTSKPDAYNLYLLARQHWISGNAGDRRRDELVVRICRQATTIDPGYANAWALMALAQCELNLMFGLRIDGREAAERALELDPGVPEALCVKARYMAEDGEIEQAISQVEAVLRDQPDSWQANKEMAYLIFRSGRVEDSVPYFEKAVKLMDTDYHDAGMLMTCYEALGDLENMRRIGKVTFERVEKAVAQDPSNGTAMAMGAGALGAMGDADRAREWIDRTMLVDPDNINARYNLACSLVSLGDLDGAIDLLGPYFDEVEPLEFRHSDVDPDMAPLRSLPRYQEMRESARGRLGLPASAANQ